MKPAFLSSKPISWLYRVVLFFAWAILKVLYRHRVYGLEHYYSGAAIIASNHVSNLDPPILSTSWPEEVHFLAREGLFKNRFFGGFIRRLNAHPVSGDASDIKVFKTICRLLDEGKKLILFPEGTRNFVDELGELKPGVALLISRTKSAIIPAYIHGSFEVWNRKRKFPRPFGKIACVFGTPLLWSDFDQADKKQAQKALLAQISISINALRSWYREGAHGIPP
jgi:1-acyl-sn-glycerol-3-phosphate acyltransferase